MRASPVYSACERIACSIGMCGQKSGPPFRLVRSAAGPKKPSLDWVASTPLIHRSVSVSTRPLPVAYPRLPNPLSQYGNSSHPPRPGLIHPVLSYRRKCEISVIRPLMPSS
jgi:hypothetical protein